MLYGNDICIHQYKIICFCLKSLVILRVLFDKDHTNVYTGDTIQTQLKLLSAIKYIRVVVQIKPDLIHVVV